MKKLKRTTAVTPKFLMAGVLTFIFVLVLSFAVGSFNSSDAKAANSDPAKVKYYKSIQIEAGDSLWSIAKEYMNENYDSIYHYIDELLILNQLDEQSADQIQEGGYLTVAYYAEAGR